MEQKKELNLIETFEYMRDIAELKALSNISLEQPLTDKQYKRMIELSKKLNMILGEWTI